MPKAFKKVKAATSKKKTDAPAPVQPVAKLPSAFRLLRTTFGTLKRHWKVFGGIVVIYGVLNVLLVQSFNAAGSLGDAKTTLDQAFTGSLNQLASGASLFVYLLGTSGNAVSGTAGAYQFLLIIIVSLAIIYTLREVYAGHAVRIRDGFYQGMTPLIKFILVLGMVVLGLLPLVIGALLYGTVTANGIATALVEQLIWLLVFGLLALWSLYLLSASIFALYIITLPGMTPLHALRTAKQLVQGRRFALVRKLMFLPLALVLLAAIVMIPLILFATPLAVWIFFGLTMVLLAAIHSYVYALYRSMI